MEVAKMRGVEVGGAGGVAAETGGCGSRVWIQPDPL